MTGISATSGNGRLFKGGFLALALAIGLLFAFSSQGLAATYIGEARAKSIALKHAGVSEAKANVVNLARFVKRGTMVYKVVFLANDAKYYYELNAASGEIVAYNRNARKDAKPGAAAQSGQTYIGNEKAEEIALAHAKVSRASVRKFDIELDNHRGRTAYEVEFTTDQGVEYDYEIDAVTGEILKWESEHD